MARVFAALAAVFAATSAGAPAPIDFLEPSAADPSTARLAIASGSSEHRVAVWTARNAGGELCLGSRFGASTARPAAFTCLRRGLEQPLVAVVRGGGRGNQATWGVIAGVTSPLVHRLSAETLWGTRTASDVPRRVVPGFAGWRAFTSGPLEHPWSTIVRGFAADGPEVTEQGGSSIHPPLYAVQTTPPPGTPAGIGAITVPPPPVNGQAPPTTGPEWSAAATNLPRAGAVARRAIPLALADEAVRTILSTHSAWLVGMTGWRSCGGRPLGGVVTFRFAEPASFEATLPAVGDPVASSSYSTQVRKIRATSWAGMDVWVDTGSKAVVGVHERGPLPYEDRARTTTLAIVVPAHDGGGPDSGHCAVSSGD